MRNRACARAVARRRQPQPWLPWILLLLVSLAVALVSAADAAPADQSPPTALQKQPPAGGVVRKAPGVLAPRTNTDPGMALPTPNPQKFPMPVLKPRSGAGQPAAPAK